MAYSEDFRKRALEYMEEGHTYTQLYEAFKIYPATIEDWRKLLAKTGSLKPQYRKARKRKIDKDELSAAVKEKPDAYLHELAKQFNCTKQAVFYALENLNQTYKKNPLHTRKNRKRQEPSI
jgi:transposase